MKDNLKDRWIPVLLFFLTGCLPVLVSFYFGLGEVLRSIIFGYSIILSVILYYSDKKVKLFKFDSRIPFLLLLLLVQGMFIGIFFLSFGYNKQKSFWEYSILALLAFVGYRVGEILVVGAPPERIFNYLLAIGTSDVLFIIAKMNIWGVDARSSFGTTNLIPVFLFAIFIMKGKILIKLISTLSLIFGLLGTFMSGMRSSTTITVIQIIVYLVVISLRKRVEQKLWMWFVLVSFSVVCVLLMYALNFVDKIDDKVEMVVSRMNNSLFRNGEIKLDEGEDQGRGRVVEAEIALDEQYDKSGIAGAVLGMGHGFVFVEPENNNLTAHVHFTIVAYFVRYGIVGVVIYLYIIGCLITNLIYSLRNKSWYLSIELPVSISAIYLAFLSLVSGTLVYPSAWIIIGITLSLNKSQARTLVKEIK